MSEAIKDQESLNKAIEVCVGFIEANAGIGDEATYVDAMKMQAMDRLVKLLERKAKLLGLDAQPNTSKPGETQPETESAAVRAIRDVSGLRVAK